MPTQLTNLNTVLLIQCCLVIVRSPLTTLRPIYLPPPNTKYYYSYILATYLPLLYLANSNRPSCGRSNIRVYSTLPILGGRVLYRGRDATVNDRKLLAMVLVLDTRTIPHQTLRYYI